VAALTMLAFDSAPVCRRNSGSTGPVGRRGQRV